MLSVGLLAILIIQSFTQLLVCFTCDGFLCCIIFCSCLSTLIVRCKCSEKLEQRPDVQLSASVQSHRSLRLPGKQLVPRLLRFQCEKMAQDDLTGLGCGEIIYFSKSQEFQNILC